MSYDLDGGILFRTITVHACTAVLYTKLSLLLVKIYALPHASDLFLVTPVLYSTTSCLLQLVLTFEFCFIYVFLYCLKYITFLLLCRFLGCYISACWLVIYIFILNDTRYLAVVQVPICFYLITVYTASNNLSTSIIFRVLYR